MNHNTPGLPIHHQLPEFTQTKSNDCYPTALLISTSKFLLLSFWLVSSQDAKTFYNLTHKQYDILGNPGSPPVSSATATYSPVPPQYLCVYVSVCLCVGVGSGGRGLVPGLQWIKKNNNKKTKDAQALYIKWSSTADIWIHRLWSVDFADAEIAVPEGWLYV